MRFTQREAATKNAVAVSEASICFGLCAIYATGVLEFVGSVGLLLPNFRGAAAFCLVVLLIAMFPANVKAAIHRPSLVVHSALNVTSFDPS